MTDDLTTLTAVKSWLGLTNDTSDELLSRLISSASRFVLNHLGRHSLRVQEVTEIYDGYGQNFMLVRQWPVVSVSEIQYSGISLTTEATGNPRSSGFLLEPARGEIGGQQRVTLFGYCFPRGRAGIALTYRFGYLIADEAQTVPADTAYTITTDRLWLADSGVKYASSDVALVSVSANPAQGQYSVAGGVYTFNEADASEEILVSYSYVPEDISQAVCEMVGERFKAKDRIGVQNKSLSGGVGETISFSKKDMNDYVRSSLQPYRTVTPA